MMFLVVVILLLMHYALVLLFQTPGRVAAMLSWFCCNSPCFCLVVFLFSVFLFFEQAVLVRRRGTDTKLAAKNAVQRCTFDSLTFYSFYCVTYGHTSTEKVDFFEPQFSVLVVTSLVPTITFGSHFHFLSYLIVSNPKTNREN